MGVLTLDVPGGSSRPDETGTQSLCGSHRTGLACVAEWQTRQLEGLVSFGTSRFKSGCRYAVASVVPAGVPRLCPGSSVVERPPGTGKAPGSTPGRGSKRSPDRSWKIGREAQCTGLLSRGP